MGRPIVIDLWNQKLHDDDDDDADDDDSEGT